MIFTVDPKNVQTILATQFKDFGLGDARNNNFKPLLGHGIVSYDAIGHLKLASPDEDAVCVGRSTMGT
jgi:hypothetical protein